MWAAWPGRELDLLDVGAARDASAFPATECALLRHRYRYPDPAPNLREADILQEPIGFGDRRFDIVVAQGLFEYMGEHQDEKLAEIRQVLKDHGRFVTAT
jgi:SAM-dependent methyltransferase